MILPSIANPYVMLAAVAVLAATNAYTWHATKANTEVVERAAYAEQVRKQKEANDAELDRVNGLVLAAQRAHAKDVQAIVIAHQLELEHRNEEAAAALARHRSGAARLSIPANCAKPAGSTVAGVPGAGAAAASVGSATRAELTDDAAAFLIDLAKRADAAIGERNLAVEIMQRDRKLIEEFNAKVRRADQQ